MTNSQSNSQRSFDALAESRRGKEAVSAEQNKEKAKVTTKFSIPESICECYTRFRAKKDAAKLALMADLVPLLTKPAGGRNISGLSAYES